MASNARHALGEGDGGQAAAIRESILSDARHALGNGDGGQAAATLESFFSNARHSIGLAIIGDGGGDGDCSSVFVGVTITRTSSIRHRQVGIGGNVVVNTTHIEVFGTRREAAQ